MPVGLICFLNIQSTVYDCKKLDHNFLCTLVELGPTLLLKLNNIFYVKCCVVFDIYALHKRFDEIDPRLSRGRRPSTRIFKNVTRNLRKIWGSSKIFTKNRISRNFCFWLSWPVVVPNEGKNKILIDTFLQLSTGKRKEWKN